MSTDGDPVRYGKEAAERAAAAVLTPDPTSYGNRVAAAHGKAVKKAPPTKKFVRVLYVVETVAWTLLPAEVKKSARQELDSIFAFVGQSASPLISKIVPVARLPERFDFTESVVSVISGSPEAHVAESFALQEQYANSWLTGKGLATLPNAPKGRTPASPERVGRGGHGKQLIVREKRRLALPTMAGAVNAKAVVKDFLENVNVKAADALRGVQVVRWPADNQSMLGMAFGRAIAHEARHEYIVEHAENGLGQDSPFVWGEKYSERFHADDCQAILETLRAFEKKQGTVEIVPTYPIKGRSGLAVPF